MPTERIASEIDANVAKYVGERRPTGRYASFDYCFNYFQQARADGEIERLASAERMQLSCLQLGFYLASWGMLRGSTSLLQRSVKHYEPVVQAIVEMPRALWEVDVHTYSDSWNLVLECAKQLRDAFPHAASDTLVTKLMLGVYGCVPAFDTYFRRGFGAWTFGRKSLLRLEAYYFDHRSAIDAHRIGTLDFQSENETDLRYTRAKVLDMHFFIEGQPG